MAEKVDGRFDKYAADQGDVVFGAWTTIRDS